MYSLLKSQELDEAAEEMNPAEIQQARQPVPVVYNDKIPPEFFDFILIDECHRSIYNSKFVYLQALAPFFNSKVRSEASATTLPILNKSKFQELPFILCTLTEQQEIVRLLERQFVAVEQLDQEIDSALEKAEILRQSILKKAFSGELVPQDPNDEPASELLNRITEEKTRRDTAVKVATRKASP